MFIAGQTLFPTIFTAKVAYAQSKAPVTMITGVFARGASGSSYAAEYVAAAKNYWKNVGLDLQYLHVRGAAIPPALMSGEADFGASLVTMLPPVSAGADLVLFAEETQTYDGLYVLSNKALEITGITNTMSLEEKIRRLKGLKIGYSQPGSIVDQITRQVLARFGLNADSHLQLVSLGSGPSMIAALQRGHVDGFVYISPFPQKAEKMGLGKVIISVPRGDIPDFKGFTHTSYSTARKTLKTRRDVLVRFIKGMILGNDFVLNHPEEAAEIVAKAIAEPDVDLIKGILVEAKNTIVRIPFVDKAHFNKTLGFFNKTAKNKVTKGFDDLVDNSIVEQAATELRKEGRIK